MSQGRTCSEGTWCPEKSTRELACNAGAYCPSGAHRQIQWIGPTIAFLLLAAIPVSVVLLRLRKRRIVAKQNKSLAGVYELDQFNGLFDKTETHQSRDWQAGATASLTSATEPGSISVHLRGVGFVEPRIFSSCRDVNKQRWIVKGIDCEFQTGTFSAIMGPSGCGKSTILRMVHGIYAPSAGRVYLNGIPDVTAKYAREIGYVPQDEILLKHLTVKEAFEFSAHLRLPPTLSPAARQRIVERTLTSLELMAVASRPIVNLSGGQQRRANIGVEMVALPRVLILDEPTSGLDASAAEMVCNHLHEISKGGVCVIAVIHQPRPEVFRQLDHLVLLGKQGRLVYEGAPASVKGFLSDCGYECPQQTFIADYMLDVLTGKAENSFSSQDAYLRLDDEFKNRRRAESTKSMSSAPDLPPPATAVPGSSFATVSVVVSQSSSSSNNNNNNSNNFGADSPVPLARRRRALPVLVGLYVMRTAILSARQWVVLLSNAVMHVLAGIIVGLPFSGAPLFVAAIPTAYAGLQLCPPAVANFFCLAPVVDLTFSLNDYSIVAVALQAVAIGVRGICNEKLVMAREWQSGGSRLAYLLAKWITDAVFSLFYSLLFSAALISVSDIEGTIGNFWMIFFLMEYCVCAFGQILGSVAALRNGTLIGVVSCLCWIVTDGSVFSVSQMSILGWVSYPRWAAEAIFLTTVPYGSFSTDEAKSLQTYMSGQYGWVAGNYPNDLGVLFILGLCFRLIHTVIVYVGRKH